MNSSVRDLGKVAQRPARNPLGIITFFIVLIYGFAALLLGTSGESLEPDQRWPIVWFVVFFPVVVLGAFYRLVTHHHQKLYPPMDYRDERLFLRTLPPEEQRDRVAREIDELSAQDDRGPSETAPGPSLPPLPREGYLLAQELAFRQLELDFGRPINRYLGVAGQPHLAFDGGLTTQAGVVFIEVKYGRQPFYSPRILREVLKRRAAARAALPDRYITLYLVVVAEMAAEHRRQLEENIRSFLSSEQVRDVELRVFDLGELRRRFGAEAAS